MSEIRGIRHIIKDDDGNRVNRIEYTFSDDASDWEKEAVREYGCTSKDEFEDAIEWREAIDEMDNEQAARVMRGKHPTDDDKEIGRPNNPGNRPHHAGQ